MKTKKDSNKLKLKYYEKFRQQEEFGNADEFAMNYYFEENPLIKKFYNDYLGLPGKEKFSEEAEKEFYEFTEISLPEYMKELVRENKFKEIVSGVPF